MKFESLPQALFWYITHNPARQKAINLLETERGTRPPAEQFSGLHDVDTWAAIVCALRDVLDRYDGREALAFRAHEIGLPPGNRIHADEIAEKLAVRPATVYRWIRDIRQALEHELQLREVL